MKKKIIIVAGDPISINSEIIFKSWKKIDNSLKKKIVVIANFKLIEKQFKKIDEFLKKGTNVIFNGSRHALKEIKNCLNSGDLPEESDRCDYCAYNRKIKLFG